MVISLSKYIQKQKFLKWQDNLGRLQPSFTSWNEMRKYWITENISIPSTSITKWDADATSIQGRRYSTNINHNMTKIQVLHQSKPGQILSWGTRQERYSTTSIIIWDPKEYSCNHRYSIYINHKMRCQGSIPDNHSHFNIPK